MKKQLPEYLTYESDAPRGLRWVMETGLGATVFFLGAIGMGFLLGALFRWVFA